MLGFAARMDASMPEHLTEVGVQLTQSRNFIFAHAGIEGSEGDTHWADSGMCGNRSPLDEIIPIEKRHCHLSLNDVRHIAMSLYSR